MRAQSRTGAPRREARHGRAQRVAAGVSTVVLAAGLTIAGGQASASAATCTGVNTWAGLVSAFNSGGTATLCATITAAADQQLSVGATPVTLDLNGHDLSITDPANDDAAIDVTSGHTLTITDTSTGTPGTLTATGDYEGGAGIGGGRGADGGTVIIQGDATVTATGGAGGGAGIGGGHDADGGTVTIQGNATVTATGGVAGAGIGNGSASFGDAGTVTIQGDATVTATGGVAGGAGIGGARIGNGGTVTIGGNATVTATGGNRGAGIGSVGGAVGVGATVTIGGNATVTATGGDYGAGIGGGDLGAGGTVTIGGSASVTATGGTNAAGIGGSGPHSNGGAVTINQGATVTAAGGDGVTAIGAGAGGGSFGSLSNAGTLIIPAGAELDIPSGTTVDNSGTVTNNGALQGAGAVANTGTITTGAHGTVAPTLAVTGHNYLLQFTTAAGSVSPTDLPVYAATVTDSGQSLPAPTGLPGGETFDAWHDDSGTAVAAGTDLTGYGSSDGTPVTVGLHAVFAQSITFTSTPPDPAVATHTYTVSATGGPSGNPVQFGVAPSTVCTLTGATVTFSTAGTCTITATQAGSTNFAKGTATQQIAVAKKTSTVTVTSPDHATTGSPVQFKVTVAGDPPTGTVSLTAGSTTLGTATLDADGTASITTSDLPAGTDTVTATYSGDPTYANATGTATITVTPPATTTTTPPSTPTHTPSPTSSASTVPLANTGTDAASGLRLAGVLLVAGFGLLLAGFGWQRRRRH